MEKIKEFIKNKKDFIFGILCMCFSSVIMVYIFNLLNFYNIDVKHSSFIFVFCSCSYVLWKDGFDLLFIKNKEQKKF